MNELIERYLSCWNETDTDTRSALIAETWAAAATYIDPMVEAHGVEEIDAVIGAVQNQFPGFVFSQVGTADVHHSQARFRWGIGPADEEPVVIGFDVAVAVADASGRLITVLGFLDKVPS